MSKYGTLCDNDIKLFEMCNMTYRCQGCFDFLDPGLGRKLTCHPEDNLKQTLVISTGLYIQL